MPCFGTKRTICAASYARKFSADLCFRWFALGILLLTSTVAGAGTTQYYYDDLGRVIQAIRSDGAVRQYQYDENGNITAINRVSAGTLSISGLSPTIGHVGATVTIFGTGFSSTPNQNEVEFGAIPAVVTAATSTSLVVTVPVGAATGAITVTEGGDSATSATTYVVRKPAIVSYMPIAAAPGGSVTVAGSNLNLVPGTTTVSVGGAPVTVTSLSNSQLVFKAPTASGSGPIQIATSYGVATSASHLIVAHPDTAPNVVAAAILPVGGGSQNLDVPSTGKFGVFTFSATQGQYLSLQITSLTTSPANREFNYAVYGPTNALLTTGYAGINRPSIHLPRVATTGTHLLVFAAGSGTFQMSAHLEVNAALSSNAAPLTISTDILSQSKRFIYSASAGEQLGFALADLASSASWGSMPVQVYGPDGGQLGVIYCDLNAPPGCQSNLQLTVAGTYSIIVFPAGAVTMSFKVFLSPYLTGSLALDAPVNADLTIPGQYRKYSFTATAGQTVALGVSSVTTTPSGKGISIRVSGPNGMQAGADDYRGPILNLPNLAAGTYTVVLYTVDAAIATMQLTLASGMTGQIPIDDGSASFAGTLRGQHGYFTFEGTAGEDLGLAILDAAAAPGGGNITFSVYLPNGAQLGNTFHCSPTDKPGCQMELRNLPTTGTYRIVVGPTTNSTISFALRLTHHLTGTLNVGTPYPLNLSVPGQHAALTFTATSGMNATINVSSIATTPTYKAIWLSVFNSAGNNVGGNGSSSAFSVALSNLPADTYKVFVRTIDAATATMNVTVQ